MNRLGAALGAKFVEEAARVSLDRVLADEQAVGDFAVAESGGNEAKNFEFTRRDAEFVLTSLVDRERLGGSWLTNDLNPPASKRETSQIPTAANRAATNPA